MTQRQQAEQLVTTDGETYAHEAGITLKDKPSPLYQLLVLTTLLSAPITSNVSIAAARELFTSGYRTPAAIEDATWQELVDALGRGHYRRYDESTATALHDGARLLRERWHGDLRELRAEADGDPDRVRELLQEIPRIGPVGAEIFCREAQGLWPELRPSFDSRALKGAAMNGLPKDAEKLGALVPPSDLPNLAAALVRSTV